MQTGQYRRRTLRVIAVVIWSAILLAPGHAQGQPTYIGSDVCEACHEIIANQFKKSAHVGIQENKKGKWADKACEACHGPGSKHAETAAAEDIRNPLKVENSQADKICFQCHLNQNTFSGKLRSSHFKNMVPCTTCHKIHATPQVALTPMIPGAPRTQLPPPTK